MVHIDTRLGHRMNRWSVVTRAFYPLRGRLYLATRADFPGGGRRLGGRIGAMMAALPMVNPHVEVTALIPGWVDVVAVALAAFFTGVALTERRTALVGALFAGVLVGIGGGVIRDLLLGLRPAATQNHWYVLIGALFALLGVMFAHLVPVDAWLSLLLDSCVIGLFAVIGANKALVFDSPWPVAILLGVTTGIGGGILLDVVRGDKPIIFGGDSQWAAPATLIGTSLCVGLAYVLPGPAAGWIGGVTLVVLRMCGAKWHWSDPTVHQVSLPDQRSSPAA